MKISPNYDAIKVRAIELLTTPPSFNGFSLAEMKSFPSALRNNVGVALCLARDEIDSRTFNKGNFKKAEGEIACIMYDAGQQKGPAS